MISNSVAHLRHMKIYHVQSLMSMCIVYGYFSIDQLSEVARNAIEAGCKIKEELIIDQESFLVSEVRQGSMSFECIPQCYSVVLMRLLYVQMLTVVFYQSD